MPLNSTAWGARVAPRWFTVCEKPLVYVAMREPSRCLKTSDSERVRACGGFSINTRKRTEMENALTVFAVLVVWWVMQVWLLPRFGVPT